MKHWKSVKSIGATELEAAQRIAKDKRWRARRDRLVGTLRMNDRMLTLAQAYAKANEMMKAVKP